MDTHSVLNELRNIQANQHVVVGNEHVRPVKDVVSLLNELAKEKRVLRFQKKSRDNHGQIYFQYVAVGVTPATFLRLEALSKRPYTGSARPHAREVIDLASIYS